MSDNATQNPNQDGQDTSDTTSGAGGDAKQITMTPKQLAERLERAKPSDYEDLKAKAAQFDELVEANKTEIEKANERAAKAEAEAAQLPAKVAAELRSHLIELHQIPDDKAELFLTASEPELLRRQVAALIGAEGDRRKNGNHVPTEGTAPTAKTGDTKRDFLRSLRPD